MYRLVKTNSSEAPITISGVTSGTSINQLAPLAVRDRHRARPIARVIPIGVATSMVRRARTNELRRALCSVSSWRSEALGSPVHQRSEKPCQTERLRPPLNENKTAMATGRNIQST